MHDVNLVNPGGLGKFLGYITGIRDRLVVFLFDIRIDGYGEVLQGSRDSCIEFRQINDGQGCLVTAGRAGRLDDEVINDLLAQFDCRNGCVRGQPAQPVRVVPAGARFGFFRSDQVICVRCDRDGCFRIGHQAGVEADDIKLDAGIGECLGDLRNGHGDAGMLLVMAVAGDRAAAVIPQDEHIAVSREVLGTEPDEVSQVARIGHDPVIQRGQPGNLPAGHDLVPLVDLVGDDGVIPFPRPAGFNNDIHVVSLVGIQHFVQVRSGHTVIGFQVRSAHVNHDGYGILAVAFQLRELIPHAADRSRVDLLGVNLGIGRNRRVVPVEHIAGGLGRSRGLHCRCRSRSHGC